MLANAYRRALKALGLRHTITHYLRESHDTEPVAWVVASLATGAAVGAYLETSATLYLAAGLAVGLVLGHLFWK